MLALMGTISSKDAAARLKISVRRVQELIRNQRLPAKMIGGVYLIEEEDLALVKNRKAGRPRTREAAAKKRETSKKR
jgi:DNA binding domain, excisionase family